MDYCSVLRDSIAQGISWQVPSCYSITVSGINSRNFNDLLFKNLEKGPIPDDHILISLGSNDGNDPDLEIHLDDIRSRLNCPNVTWLLSANNQYAYNIVVKVANAYKDQVIEIKPYVSRDGVHPTAQGYRDIAKRWQNL